MKIFKYLPVLFSLLPLAIASLPTKTIAAELEASDGSVYDQFGDSTGLSGSTGLVGAVGKDVGADSNQGAAYVFRNLDTATGTVTQSVKLMASDGANFDRFGKSVGLDGDRFVIGAPSGDGLTTNTGTAYSGNVSSFTIMDDGNTSQTISVLSFISEENWIIGATTSNNALVLSEGDIGKVKAKGKGIFGGQNDGASDNTLEVQGEVTANAITVSAPAGSSGNMLVINEKGFVNSAAITLNPGGALLLSGDPGNRDRLGAKTKVVLAGGTFDTGGVSEGKTAVAGLKAITLTASSIIDLGSGASILHFAKALSWQNGAVLSVYNWTGSPKG